MTNIVYNSRQKGCWKTKRASFSLRFGICLFGIWDLLWNFCLECVPNVHTKFATLKFCEEKIQPLTAGSAITLEADGQISVVLCGQPEFLRQNQNFKHPQRNGDHGLGEKDLRVQNSRSCCEQWFVVNSGFQKKKEKIILPIRWPDKSYVWQWNKNKQTCSLDCQWSVISNELTNQPLRCWAGGGFENCKRVFFLVSP